MNKFTSGVKSIDKLINKIECGVITQFFGHFGTGKSILSQQLCVTVQLSKENDGLNSKAIFIDSEGSFHPSKIIKIAKRFRLNITKTLKNIFYKKVWNFNEQFLALKLTEDYVKKFNIKLIVIDSIATHVRGEFPSLDILIIRQNLLKKFLEKLLDICSKYDIAGIITNQVISGPSEDKDKKWKLKPIGGNIINFYCKHILQFGRIGEKRYAKIYESSNEDKNYALFSIKDDGIHDIGD